VRVGVAVHEGWFEGSFEEGLAQARATSKLLFVDFNTTWCPPCRKLEKETFPDPAVKAELGKMVAMSIDAESPAGIEPAKRYRVAGYPTMLVVDGDGKEIGRIVGFREPEELSRKLEEIRGRVKR
jgi:thiol:disulfide interchange protein